MGFKSKVNKLCAFGYVLSYIAKHRRSAGESERILIYIFGHMGDVLMDVAAIETLIRFYNEQGKQVYLAGTTLIQATLRMFISLDQVTFISVKDTDVEYGDVREIMQILGDLSFERLITVTPWDMLFALNLAACVNSSESVGTGHRRHNIAVSGWRLFLQIIRRSYTQRILADAGMSQPERAKILLHSLGIKEFQTTIAYIPKQCDYSVTGKYITVAVDSMDAPRRWPAERFIDLVEKLLERWDADIYITGSRLEQHELDQYVQVFQNNERVKITVGCLKLSEWIELIRNSSFHIGVDSGSIHVAASVGTTSFCLAGVWECFRWVPYRRDLILPGTAEPICIYRSDVDVRQLSCRGCFGKKEYGYKNRACLQACRQKQPCLCLSKITPDDVMAAIDHAREAGVIE